MLVYSTYQAKRSWGTWPKSHSAEVTGTSPAVSTLTFCRPQDGAEFGACPDAVVPGEGLSEQLLRGSGSNSHFLEHQRCGRHWIFLHFLFRYSPVYSAHGIFDVFSY